MRPYADTPSIGFGDGVLVHMQALRVRRGAQAFAAVQASVVHLQGVPLSKRFALVPLGPPLLTYSSTCKA